MQKQKEQSRADAKAEELKAKKAKVLADVQKNRRDRRQLEQQLAKDLADKTDESIQKELTKKFATRAKAATRKPEQRRNDEQAMRQMQSGWLIPQMTPEQFQQIRQIAHEVNRRHQQRGSGKPKTKEVLNIPKPILEYFDVKNDPHFIRAHRPTAPK